MPSLMSVMAVHRSRCDGCDMCRNVKDPTWKQVGWACLFIASPLLVHLVWKLCSS